MDPLPKSDISSATISSSNVTTRETSTMATSNAPAATSAFSRPNSSSSAAVPTTVITSARNSVLPFPFRHDSTPTPIASTQQQTENPNLVSLLSGNCDDDLPQPPPRSESLHSVLRPKEPNSDFSRSSSHTSAASGNHFVTHHTPQQNFSEKCQSFFLSTGMHPSSAFMPACATQNNTLAPKSNNCMIYKGIKKLCNSQSWLKCKSSSSSCSQSNCESISNPPAQPAFNPNFPFGSPLEAFPPASAPASSTSASQANCILSDLLRSGCNNKSRNGKNGPFPEHLSPMETANVNERHGPTMSDVLAASIQSELMESRAAPPPVAASKECGGFNMAYYSQLLKQRIKKLYHETEQENVGEIVRHRQPEPPMPQMRPRSSSHSEVVPSNHTRQSVISKLGAYPQHHIQQAQAAFCSKIAEMGYKLPYCQPSTSAAVGSHTTAANQSVNSYLDSLIRHNVARQQKSVMMEPPPAPMAAFPQTTSVVTTLAQNGAVITTAADINPNRPAQYVNLIDKIISNVFTLTTASSTVTTDCFLSPNSSATQSTQATASLASVLSSPSQSEQSASNSRPPSAPLAPPATPPRPPSNVSAITQLLNSDGSPPASPPSQAESGFHSERASQRPSPCPSRASSQPMECLSEISDKVYQQLIEFEFNHESILKKFQTSPNSDSMSHSSSSRPGLNPNERARIEELEKVLYPLQFCLSTMCEQRAALKRNLHKSFFDANSNVSVDFQRQTLLATTEQAINLLIELTKQLESFSELSSADQMNLLRTSVMEIMLMRSILIMPQRLKEKMCNLKRCFDENAGEGCSNSSNSSSEPSIDQNKLFNMYMAKMGKESDVESVDELPGKEQMEPCPSHPHERPFAELGGPLDHQRLEELMNDDINSESSRDSFSEDGFPLAGAANPNGANPAANGDNVAADYAKQFRAHYMRLARSIDKDWYEDRTIFYLLFAILLFRPNKANIMCEEKVREEHLTYVYLLKRYLENKFKSYCTARSHFIRIFDRLEELQKMNDQVIQKLLDFDLVCAQNLLEKLCIC